MKFQRMTKLFPGQERWGCVNGAFTFVITRDEPDGFTASAKVMGTSPFDGTRHDLGGYCAHKSFSDAEKACRDFYRNRNA